MWLVSLIVLFLIWIIQDLWKSRKILELSRKLPNPYIALPLIGHGYLFTGSDIDRMNVLKTLGEASIKNNGIVGLWMGRTFFTMVTDAVLIETVLKNCLGKPDVVTKICRKLLGNGSIFAPIDIWRSRRKSLVPIFSPKNLGHFMAIFNKKGAIMVKDLETTAGVGITSIWKYTTAYTMESVCETTLSVNMETHRKQEFMNSFGRYSQLTTARILQPWLHSDFMYRLLPSYSESVHYRNIIWDLIDEIIKIKRGVTKTRNSQNEKKNNGLKTFLELLIESKDNETGNSYNDEELREEILVIVLAGSDTSSVVISFIASVLSRFPEVQQKVYDELQEVFGDSNRPVTSVDLAKLKYFDAVIKETLRLYPPVPIITRSVDEDIQLPSGITLIKDTEVLINIWALHRNPQYWGQDAEKFNPERFLQGELEHPSAFIPFAGGPRKCLGYQYAMMSIKTALSTLLRHYKFLPADSSGELKKEISVKYSIILRSSDEFAVRLEKRHSIEIERHSNKPVLLN